jgi:periplasmic protein TonB
MKKSILWISFAMNICKLTAQTPVDTSKSSAIDSNSIICMIPYSPTFPGGEQMMFKFMRETIYYPPIAVENEVQGTIYVGFIIQSDGQITDISIKRGVICPDIEVKDVVTGKIKYIKNTATGSLEAEAKRVVAKMPKWVNTSGNPVRYTLPIKFKLD